MQEAWGLVKANFVVSLDLKMKLLDVDGNVGALRQDPTKLFTSFDAKIMLKSSFRLDLDVAKDVVLTARKESLANKGTMREIIPSVDMEAL